MLSILLAAAVAASASASSAPPPSTSASVTPAPTATALPSGHPTVPGRRDARANPAFFQPPPDTSEDETALPSGTIRVEIRDASNNIVANRAVELGIVQQSVAKGEKHEHVSATTGADGLANFSGLETGTGVAYRVTVHESDAVFAASPFQLGRDHGKHVVLHIYPVVRELPHTVQVGTRGIVFVEVKDDRIMVQQRIDLFNGTPTAWVPKDVVLKLPPTFTALSSMQQMSDIGVDSVPEQGARLHGTFVPGENAVLFSWQLPYSGDPSVDFDLGLPPDVRQLIVRAAAAPEMKLEVQGFRQAVAEVNDEGQRELITGRQVADSDPPIRKVHIALHDLPTPGPSRLVGTVLAAVGIVTGIYLATRRRTRSTKAAAKRDRERVLDEVEQLELAHARGDIGPKTYERARRELVDELALMLATAK